ncbi:MAG: cell-wall [Planctomycetaceae bacterium]|nr:cell-wall [Planctomycetaceae bacterium]
MWKRLSKKLERRVKPGFEPVVCEDADIDLYESEFGFSLPKAYKTFILELGQGTFNRFFCIYAPLRAFNGHELFSGTREVRAAQVLSEIYGSDVNVGNLVPFAGSIIGDIFAWDVSVPHSAAQEPPVLVLPREDKKVQTISSTFKEFVDEVCFGRQYEKIVIQEEDPDWEINFEFAPTVRPQSHA